MGGKATTEMALELGPVEHDVDELGRGRKYMAVESVYAKAQRHEKVSNWSVWSVRQEMRLGK